MSSRSRLVAFPVALSLVVTAALATGCGGFGATRGDDAPAPARADVPQLTLRTIDGQTIRLADHLGKDVIVLGFWATWCKPCRAEFPFLQKLHERYKDQGLVIIGVSLDGPETQAEVKPFLKRNKYTFPVVVDRDGRIAAQLNSRSSVPLSHFIDRSGRRYRSYEGFQLGERDAIEAEIQKLLGADGPAVLKASE